MSNEIKFDKKPKLLQTLLLSMAYDAFMASEQMHWLWTEVPMIEELKDWKNVLTDGERDFLTKVFRFFTQGDIDVSSAYVNTYLPFFRHLRFV